MKFIYIALAGCAANVLVFDPRIGHAVSLDHNSDLYLDRTDDNAKLCSWIDAVEELHDNPDIKTEKIARIVQETLSYPFKQHKPIFLRSIFEVLSFLPEFGKVLNAGYVFLSKPVSDGDLDTVQLLIQYGMNPEQLLILASKPAGLPMIKMLMEHCKDCSFLLPSAAVNKDMTVGLFRHLMERSEDQMYFIEAYRHLSQKPHLAYFICTKKGFYYNSLYELHPFVRKIDRILKAMMTLFIWFFDDVEDIKCTPFEILLRLSLEATGHTL